MCCETNKNLYSQNRDSPKDWSTPEEIIEIEIDHATPEYTQYSLKNRLEVYEKAIFKNRVADFYRFTSRTMTED